MSASARAPNRCTQRAHCRVLDRHACFARQLRRHLVGAGHGGEVAQLVFEGGRKLLVRRESPALADGNASRPVSRIFSAPHAQRDDAEGRAQLHRLAAAKVRLSLAVGEKSRRVARPGPGAFLPGGGASTRGLRPRPPTPCRAAKCQRLLPSSSVPLSFCCFHSDEEPIFPAAIIVPVSSSALGRCRNNVQIT